MVQTSSAAPNGALPASDKQESTLLEPLLRLAGDTESVHALIVADHASDLMCGLIRSGCPAATTLRATEKPDCGAYGLVIVPHAALFASSDNVIRLALRALSPRGRLIVGVLDGKAAVALARRLRLNGFTNLRVTTHLAGSTLIRADLRSAT